MSDGLLLPTFVLGVVFCATPGAVNAEALRRGLAGGFAPALLVQIGSLIGDTLWALAALSGAAILLQHAALQAVLGIAGACLLLRLGWRSLREALSGAQRRPAGGGRGAFLTGAFFSLTNPTALVFWLGVGGGILGGAGVAPQAREVAVFFAGFEAGALLWCVASAALIAWGRRHLGSRFFRAVNALCGAALGYFGVRVLWRSLGTLRAARLLVG